MPKDIVMRQVGLGEANANGAPEIVYVAETAVAEEPREHPLWVYFIRFFILMAILYFAPAIALIALAMVFGLGEPGGFAAVAVFCLYALYTLRWVPKN